MNLSKKAKLFEMEALVTDLSLDLKERLSVNLLPELVRSASNFGAPPDGCFFLLVFLPLSLTHTIDLFCPQDTEAGWRQRPTS